MRGAAATDGAEEGSAVELRDDQLEGDLTGHVLERTEGHRDILFTIGRYHTWRAKKRQQGGS